MHLVVSVGTQGDECHSKLNEGHMLLEIAHQRSEIKSRQLIAGNCRQKRDYT